MSLVWQLDHPPQPRPSPFPSLQSLRCHLTISPPLPPPFSTQGSLPTATPSPPLPGDTSSPPPSQLHSKTLRLLSAQVPSPFCPVIPSRLLTSSHSQAFLLQALPPQFLTPTFFSILGWPSGCTCSFLHSPFCRPWRQGRRTVCACLSVDRALSVCLAALCALLSSWLWVMPGSSHGMETVSFGSLATLPTETTCILSNNKHAVLRGGEALSLSSPPAQLCSPAQRNGPGPGSAYTSHERALPRSKCARWYPPSCLGGNETCLPYRFSSLVFKSEMDHLFLQSLSKHFLSTCSVSGAGYWRWEDEGLALA